MNRNIKFRGKCKNTGKWMYGYLSDETETFLGKKYTRKVIFEDLKSFQTDNFTYVVRDLEVIPVTIGQFTGLHDKNGKEIYEGDIVSGLEYEDFGFGKDGSVNSIVEWRNNTCSFELVAVNELRMSLVNGLDIEVIGNIHDNPELLK